MIKTKFLYGAAVQGIQSFIFQTNKLSEIAGASELVEQICTSLFAKVIGSNVNDLAKDTNAIVTAAGNIKYVFEYEEQCKKLVLKFPKTVMEFAPGIALSQAVVAVEGEIEKEHIDELERRLWVQRNKPLRSFDVGLMAMNRSRKTGLPAMKNAGNQYFDLGTIKKESAIKDENPKENEPEKYSRLLKALFGKTLFGETTLDSAKITKTKGENYNWLAVVHTDGNNLGMALQKLVDNTKNTHGQSYINLFREFSLAIDLSTKNAANHAYLETVKNFILKPYDIIPFRPIVIGGDDLTVVCRGDIALQFTKLFLQYFKDETKANFKSMAERVEFLENGFTACAGIAYIKESYPFHYGYYLAEILCGEAKNSAKYGLSPEELTPSCLMFHKVQDSFVEEFKEIRERELCAGKGDNIIRFDFGPYYLESAQKKTTVEYLEKCVSQLEGKEGNAIKSHLRQWLTDLHNEPELAEQKKLRVISMNENKLKSMGLDRTEYWTESRKIIEKGDKKIYQFTPVYDWLTIHSINQGGK
jgi:hypothetical protein